MLIDFEALMSKKSEEGLQEYITNIKRYEPEAISAAIRELKKRGRQFSDEELAEIATKIKSKVETEKVTSLDANIVTDPSAPLLYSRQAIFGFCILMGTIFGSILLSINLRDKRDTWIIMAFGILYTAVAVVILTYVPVNALGIVLNAGGGLILRSWFWDMYIGKNVAYRARPIWTPLIIALVLVVLIIVVIIYSQRI